jgi:hypothetical protein
LGYKRLSKVKCKKLRFGDGQYINDPSSLFLPALRSAASYYDKDTYTVRAHWLHKALQANDEREGNMKCNDRSC